MAAAAEKRKPVFEIYCDEGLGYFVIKPVNEGVTKYGEQMKTPASGDRVNIIINLISQGVFGPVGGDPELESVEHPTYEQPYLRNPAVLLIRVYDDHAYISDLVIYYNQGREVASPIATEFIQRINGYRYHVGIKLWNTAKRDWIKVLEKVSIPVANGLKAHNKQSAAKGAGAGAGGSRRRRPSRKYKKSKRVLRRKSRSTRRR